MDILYIYIYIYLFFLTDPSFIPTSKLAFDSSRDALCLAVSGQGQLPRISVGPKAIRGPQRGAEIVACGNGKRERCEKLYLKMVVKDMF